MIVAVRLICQARRLYFVNYFIIILVLLHKESNRFIKPLKQKTNEHGEFFEITNNILNYADIWIFGIVFVEVFAAHNKAGLLW